MESILIVDDDIKLCTTLSEDLSDLGYTSNYVTNVENALQFISSSNVDLILLDLTMPEKDGFYLLNKLKENNHKTRTIVLTANVDVHSAIKSAKLGADDFLRKPYDFDELIITLRKVLRKEEYEN